MTSWWLRIGGALAMLASVVWLTMARAASAAATRNFDLPAAAFDATSPGLSGRMAARAWAAAESQGFAYAFAPSLFIAGAVLFVGGAIIAALDRRAYRDAQLGLRITHR